MSAKSAARSSEGWEEGEAGGRLIRNLYQVANFVCQRGRQIQMAH